MSDYTITLSRGDSQQIEAIKKLADDEMHRNPNFSGHSISVEAGDFTSVDGPDEYTGAQLLSSVRNILTPGDEL